MQCILHIGTAKAGSTAIQTFLNRNRGLLRERRILYSSALGGLENHGLHVLGYGGFRRNNYLTEQGITTPAQLEGRKKDNLNRLTRELDDADARGYQTILFSSELLQSNLATVDEIRRLKQYLDGLGLESFRIVVYLRDPAEVISSLYSTEVKCGNIALAPPSVDDPGLAVLCDHRQTLKRWSEVFGRENVTPRVFGKHTLSKGNVVADFIETAGLPRDLPYRFPARQNRRLSATGVALLGRVNVHFPRFADHGPNPARARLHEFFEAYFPAPPAYLAPKALRDECAARYARSNEWIRSNYFPELERLFPDTSPDETDGGQATVDAKDFAEAFVPVWTCLARKDACAEDAAAVMGWGEKLPDIMGGNLGGCHLLGQLHLLAGDFENALAWLGRALAPDDPLAWVHCDLSRAYAGMGKTDMAIAEARRAAALRDDVRTVSHLGNVLKDAGELSEAKTIFLDLHALRPDLPGPLLHLSEVHAMDGDLPAAAERLAQAADLSPRPRLYRRLAHLLHRMGDADGAGAALSRAKSLESAEEDRE